MKFRKLSLQPANSVDIPPLETISTNKFYSFTISPDQSIQAKGESLRLPSFVHSAKNIIYNLFNDQMIYQLYLEISPKTQNYHYHGIVVFKSYQSIIQFYDQLPSYSYNNKIELDSIDNLMIWYLYIIKQRHVMEPYCNYLNLSYKLTSKNRAVKKSILSALDSQ